MLFLFFLLSLFAYLAGFPLVSLAGIQLPLLFFFLLGLRVSLPRHLWAGILAGLILDSYRPGPLGVALLTFFLCAFLLFWGKRFFVTHYFWGDAMLVISGLIAGVGIFTFFRWMVGGGGVSFSFLFQQSIILGILASLVLLLIRSWYGRGGVENEAYAR